MQKKKKEKIKREFQVFSIVYDLSIANSADKHATGVAIKSFFQNLKNVSGDCKIWMIYVVITFPIISPINQSFVAVFANSVILSPSNYPSISHSKGFKVLVLFPNSLLLSLLPDFNQMPLEHSFRTWFHKGWREPSGGGSL